MDGWMGVTRIAGVVGHLFNGSLLAKGGDKEREAREKGRGGDH